MPFRYIRKDERGAPTTAAEIAAAAVTPNTIDGLYGTGITISLSNLILLIKKGGVLLAQVVISEIVTWSIEGQSITVITEDPTPLQLKFVSNTERDAGLLVLENAMNL